MLDWLEAAFDFLALRIPGLVHIEDNPSGADELRNSRSKAAAEHHTVEPAD